MLPIFCKGRGSLFVPTVLVKSDELRASTYSPLLMATNAACSILGNLDEKEEIHSTTLLSRLSAKAWYIVTLSARIESNTVLADRIACPFPSRFDTPPSAMELVFIIFSLRKAEVFASASAESNS